jgi:ubiquinone/menaquinone biosynthesis C-methylase UbiE
MPDPLICDYEGSDYQSSCWERGGREYEDRVEAIALKRLLPSGGHLLLEVGAGAGRNTLRYAGFERIVVLDYSRTQLQQAQARLGTSDRFIYVAADANRLPFVDGLFDAVTMIRVLHHMLDAPGALGQVRQSLVPGGVFILEFANKLNLKAIFRYLIGRQEWSPFALSPVEFAPLNFDFHPRAIRNWLRDLGFRIEKTLAVSHFRIAFLKHAVPVGALAAMDSALQWTGALWQLTPSVFLRARLLGAASSERTFPWNASKCFKCPECGHTELQNKVDHLLCPNCQRRWTVDEGIYDFREPIQ